MTDRISPREFLESPGVEDWRLLSGGAWAGGHFRTGSFALGAALVAVIGELAAAADHHPDVDLRPEGVTVRLSSPAAGGLSSPDGGGLTGRDVELARRISAAARELGAPGDPAVVQHVQVAIDALVIPAVLPFWRAVLGYAEVGDEDVIDPLRRGPTFWFQQMDAPRPQRNRVHIDVYLPPEQVAARISAALAAGGRVVADRAPHWWTLADPEGNEVDLAIWLAP